MNSLLRDIKELPRIAGRNIRISGRVQGVGFRPFVYRIAHTFGLSGWVRNGSGQVLIHVEGRPESIAGFVSALTAEAPPLAKPHLETSEPAAIEGGMGFHILSSDVDASADVHLPPDLFCCDDCIRELRDPTARRFRYPFTNCTQCGPRYTIIEALPYDRRNTSMARFTLCPACHREYDDPLNRRFHAQPLACPVCGPKLSFRRNGRTLCAGEDALKTTIACLREGGIIVVKGVGGYHLMCDPESDAAVNRLRARKRRPHKPLAIMFPLEGADDLASMRECVILSEIEARACADPARPIVLARRRQDCRLSTALAPGLGELGVFLPYSPLHHLLLADFGGPLVATSGNVSGEPVITDNAEAERRLAGIADAFLHHDRPIVRPADDSVVRVVAREPRPFRIGRGVAPLEIELPTAFAEPTLALGGHMKGAIALGFGHRAVVSPHIGDMDSPRSLQVFEQVVADLQALYRVEATRIVCDAHPDYATTRWGLTSGLPVVRVQHHCAHASAVAVEHPEISRWLVFAWDGVGLGSDGSLWGGETFAGAPGAWRRVGSMRPFRLTGGDRAGREPWRSAAALMWEAGHDWSPQISGTGLAREAWRKGLGTARTSSVGRLFDAASSLVLGIDVASYEGHGPMVLESQAADGDEAIRLPCAYDESGILRTDWEPLLAMLTDRSLSPGRRIAIFHESLARALVEQATTLAKARTFDAIGLSGGVFQNRRLAERAMALLAAAGISSYLPRITPTNDGGLAFGQLVEALHIRMPNYTVQESRQP